MIVAIADNVFAGVSLFCVSSLASMLDIILFMSILAVVKNFSISVLYFWYAFDSVSSFWNVV